MFLETKQHALLGTVTASFAETYVSASTTFFVRANRMVFSIVHLRRFYRVYAVTEQCECSKLTPQYSFAGCLDDLALALLSLLLLGLLASCSNPRYRF